MATTALAKGSAPATPPTDERLSTLESAVSKIAEGQEKIGKQLEDASRPNYPVDADGRPIYPGRFFHPVTGALTRDSEPYCVMKAAAVAQKWLDPSMAKTELDIHNRLKDWLYGQGYRMSHPSSLLVPFAVDNLPPPENDEQTKLVSEVRQRIKAWQGRYDPDEADWVRQRTGIGNEITKAPLATFPDTSGGVLVGFPTLGELIELQRVLEVMPNAGAREVMLPPNGRIQYPKLSGGATAYWVGEAAAITESNQSFGYLNLEPKKLAVLVKLNNELLRYTSPSTEALVRGDMAAVAARAADLAQLEGTGGTQIKGLITYESYAAWTPNTDKLIAYTVTSNLFQPNDPADMESVLPDLGGNPTAWVMRRNLWAKIKNRRADAVSAADAKGRFMWDSNRSASQQIGLELEGIKVVRSSQVSNTRGSGAQTYVILGNFNEWLIGRLGVMELLQTGVGDSPFVNDQTWMRAIQTMDAGPRHTASFVFADAITIS